jgi:hypothetical protein
MHKILESNGTYLPTSYAAAQKACQEAESKKSKSLFFSSLLTFSQYLMINRARGGPSGGQEKSIWPPFCEKMKKRFEEPIKLSEGDIWGTLDDAFDI